jgi:hypothetical protein
MSFRKTLRDVHAISSCNRLRPGLETITSFPRDRACKMFSCALSQRGPASLRQMYIRSAYARVSDAGAQSARGLQGAAVSSRPWGALWRSPRLGKTQNKS